MEIEPITVPMAGDDSSCGSSDSLQSIPQKTEVSDQISYFEFRRRVYSSELVVDNFDIDGQPYSPNIYKMWVRYCTKMEMQNKNAQSAGKEGNAATDVSDQSGQEQVLASSSQTFPGFHYRQETRDVVYDDGNGHVLLATQGTWILNDKDQLVSGPVPMTSITATHGPDGPVFNPFLNYTGWEPRVNDVNKKMRNRCYSDSQSCTGSNICYQGGSINSDSGIELDVDLEHLADTPSSPEDFKPSLNSTPHGNNYYPVPSIFVKKLKMLDSRCKTDEKINVGKQDGENVNDGNL